MIGTTAMVLPPREGFAAGSAGAIGLLVHTLARRAGGFVVGAAQEAFGDVRFVAARPSWFPGSFARRYAGGVAAALRRERPALIEVHNRPDVASFLARRFADTPVTLFLHNDPGGMRRARSAAERAALAARLARVVTVSAHLRERFGAAAVVLPNSIDLDTVPSAAKERAILFVGRVVSDKGADSFVAACALALPRLPGWRAEMIGADRFGAGHRDTPWIAALRPRAAAAAVAMPGYLPHAQVLAAMARAAIVVVPSRWDEPFGMTALEAMACGAALLYAPRGGLAEVAGDVGVPIDPEDPADIAEALVALADDPGRLAALGEAGRARARRFDIVAGAARLAALRSDVLEAWSRRRAHPI